MDNPNLSRKLSEYISLVQDGGEASANYKEISSGAQPKRKADKPLTDQMFYNPVTDSIGPPSKIYSPVKTKLP